MKDAESLRRIYNERFTGPASQWTSVDIKKCRRLTSEIIKWTGLTGRKGLSVLDVGCALGFYTKSFYLEGFEASGLDYSEVAIEKARILHPECSFIHADGFNPPADRKYDLIFCRGFSGANTHDLEFVAGWTQKYIRLLKDGGKFIFSYSTDFTGTEREGETANWSKPEIEAFRTKIGSCQSQLKFFYRYGILSLLLESLAMLLRKDKAKRYFYIIFQKE